MATTLAKRVQPKWIFFFEEYTAEKKPKRLMKPKYKAPRGCAFIVLFVLWLVKTQYVAKKTPAEALYYILHKIKYNI
jgi:hypothetical protein